VRELGRSLRPPGGGHQGHSNRLDELEAQTRGEGVETPGYGERRSQQGEAKELVPHDVSLACLDLELEEEASSSRGRYQQQQQAIQLRSLSVKLEEKTVIFFPRERHQGPQTGLPLQEALRESPSTGSDRRVAQ